MTIVKHSTRNIPPGGMAKAQGTRNIPPDEITSSPYQPREGQDETIEELAESLRRDGLLQPIAVRQVEDGSYQCVFGHRRIEAARSLGWKEITAVIMDVSPQEAADRLLEENLRRQDLTATDKARFIQRYIAEFKLTQTQAGERFGMAQETVSNLLRILNVPTEVKQLVDEGRLTGSHVKELVRIGDHPETMVKLARGLAAPAGHAATDAQSVGWAKREVDWKLEEIQRREAERAKKEGAKEKEAPKLRERLLAGLTATGDKKIPYRDPESGFPLLFGRVYVKGVLVRPAEPAFVQKEYNPQSDPELVSYVQELGVSLTWDEERPQFDYNRQWRSRYHPTHTLRSQVGKKYKGECPCGGEHVAVRGWDVHKGDPIQFHSYAHPDTNTKEAPKTVIYCADPLAVNKLLARLCKEQWESERERVRQRDLLLERFCNGPALQGGPPVAAFLIGCQTGDLGLAEKSLSHPGAAWGELCATAAKEFRSWRRHGSEDDLLKLLHLVAGGAQRRAG